MGTKTITYDDATRKICMKAAIYTGLRARTSYKVPLEITRDEWIRNTELQSLRNRKKLCLVLDLDHTLLNTKQVNKLSPEELIGLCNSSRKDDVCRWKANGVGYLTKLRPFVLKFLQEGSKLFDMYVYTNASRDYARIMVRFLDPDGLYFGSRIISREDSTVKGQKGLDVVPVDKSGVLILDDSEDVWARDRSNLVVISPYNYFAPKDPNGAGSFSQEGTDESESAGPLSNALRLLQQVHKSYFDCDNMSVKELLGIVLEDNVIHQEKLEDLVNESSLCDMGSRKRSRVNDECSLGGVTKKAKILISSL